MDIGALFHRYFVIPGYNTVNTLTYGLILALTVFGIVPVLKRIKIKLDKKFFFSVSPFIVFGATMRELVDRGFGVYGIIEPAPYPKNFWVVAPGIYLTMFVLASVVLLLSIKLFKKRYHHAFFSIGLLLALYNISLILPNMENLAALMLILTISTVVSALVILFAKSHLRFLLYEKNYLIVVAHILDATATFVGIDFLGYTEKHVLPGFLIEYFGSAWIMFPLKLIVVIPAIYIIDDEMKNDETGRRFIKFVIVILGLGPAIRDTVLAIL